MARYDEIMNLNYLERPKKVADLVAAGEDGKKKMAESICNALLLRKGKIRIQAKVSQKTGGYPMYQLRVLVTPEIRIFRRKIIELVCEAIRD